jgi:hypothetical protein
VKSKAYTIGFSVEAIPFFGMFKEKWNKGAFQVQQ